MAGAAGAANAVDVVLRLVGEVVVNNEGDVIHMDPAPGNIGGHHGADRAGAEGFEDFEALDLIDIAREHLAGDAAAAEVLGNTLGGELAIAEDDGPRVGVVG